MAHGWWPGRMEIDDAAPSYALLSPIFIYVCTYACMLSCIYAIGSLVRLSTLPWLAQRFPVKGNRGSICAVRFQQQTGSAKPPCVRAAPWNGFQVTLGIPPIRTQMRIFKDREFSALHRQGYATKRGIWGEVEAESKSGLVNPFPTALRAQNPIALGYEIAPDLFFRERITLLLLCNFYPRYLLPMCTRSHIVTNWNEIYITSILYRKKRRINRWGKVYSEKRERFVILNKKS